MMSAGTSDKQRVLKRQRNVRLAQLDRAFGYGPKGRGFESSNARQKSVNFGKGFADFFIFYLLQEVRDACHVKVINLYLRGMLCIEKQH